VSEFCYDPRWFVTKVLTPLDVKLLNYVIFFKKHFKHLYISQGRIAADLGYSRPEVNKSLCRLRAWGLIRGIYRHFQTSIYKVSSLFSMKRIKRMLRKYLFALTVQRKSHLTQLDYLVIRKLYLSSMSCHVMYICKRIIKKLPNFANTDINVEHCLPVFRPNLKRICVEEEITQEKVNAINELSKTLKLSTYGKSRLLIYPASAIKEATSKLQITIKRGIEIRIPFGFVCDIAHKTAQFMEMPLDFSLFDKCNKKYHFKVDENPHVEGFKLKKTKKRDTKMHGAYKPWKKIEEDYDYYQELKKYDKVEQSANFEATCRLLGEDTARKLLNKCKENFTQKAIENAR